MKLPSIPDSNRKDSSEFFHLPRNQFCVHYDSRHVVYFESADRVCSTSSPGTGASDNVVTYECNPPLPCIPSYMKFVSARTLLVAADHMVAVVELPGTFPRVSSSEPSSEVSSRSRTAITYQIAEHTLSARGHSVLRVDMHPLSKNHVMVLTSDSTLRLYNTARDIEDPEQVFDLRHGSSFMAGITPGLAEDEQPARVPRAVAFTFSSPTAPFWDRLSVYVLMDNGLVGVICPVLPYRAAFPRVHIDELASLASRHVSGIKAYLSSSSRDPEKNENLSVKLSQHQLQLRYLSEVTGPTIEPAVNPDVVADSDSDGDTAEPAASAEMIHIRAPGGADGGPWTPRFQIVNTPVVPPSSTTFAVDVLALPSFPPSVVIVNSDGVVSVTIGLDSRSAQWAPAVQPSRHGLAWAQAEGSLVLLEEHDLSLPSQARGPRTAMHTYLMSNPRRRDHVVCVTASGVTSIYLPVIAHLEYMTNVLDPDDPVPEREPAEFPPSHIDPVICTMPLDSSPLYPLVGVDFMFDSSSSKSKVIGTDAQSTLFTSPISLLSGDRGVVDGVATTGGHQPVTPLDVALDSVLNKPTQPIQVASLSKETVHTKSPEVVEWFLANLRRLQDAHCSRAYTIHEHVTARLDVLTEETSAQRDKLNKLTDDVATQEDFKHYLSRKLAHASESQSILVERAQLLLQMMHDKESTISVAETQYAARLKNIAKQIIPTLTMRLSESQNQIRDLAQDDLVSTPGQDDDYQLPENDLQRIRQVLEEEKSMIDSTIAHLRHVQLEVGGAEAGPL